MKKLAGSNAVGFLLRTGLPRLILAQIFRNRALRFIIIKIVSAYRRGTVACSGGGLQRFVARIGVSIRCPSTQSVQYVGLFSSMIALAVPTETVRRIIVVLLPAAATEIRIESLPIETIIVIMALAMVVIIMASTVVVIIRPAKRYRIAALECVL